MNVRPKKQLGQHFLRDEGIALRIVNSLTAHEGYTQLVEIGPGMGVLTKYLLARTDYETHAIELDRESVAYLRVHYPTLAPRLIEGDFLRLDLSRYVEGPLGIIGNFPYNISSQIFFKVLEKRQQVQEVVCMLQKEVAQRIASPPGSKDYGILSVLLQAYYDIEYLFSVPPDAFIPPPKVTSGVIRLRRNGRQTLDCDERQFVLVVKTAFGQRRKTLRNALKSLGPLPDSPLLDLRAERLGVAEFVQLTQMYQEGVNGE